MPKSEHPPRQLEVNCPKCGANVCLEQESLVFIRFFAVLCTVAAGFSIFIVVMAVIKAEILGLLIFFVAGAFMTFCAIRLWMPVNMLTATWQGTCSACNSTVETEYNKEDDGTFRQATTLLKEGSVQGPQTTELGEVSPEAAATGKVVQKIEVEVVTGETRTYDSTPELREAILNNEVVKSFRARTIQYEDGNPAPNENWCTVQEIAVADADLRSLYRPVWDCTLRVLQYGILVGIALKAVDTTVTLFALNPDLGILWILLIIAHVLSAKWALSLPLAWGGLLLLSFAEGMPNLPWTFFSAMLTTAIVGSLFGAPSGMIIGTVIGHLKRKRAAKAPDATTEGWRPYLLGIILPVAFLTLLIPLYLWLNHMILEWLYK